MGSRLWTGTGFGLACGLTMSVSGSVAFVFARIGIRDGFTPTDITVIRFAVAGLCMAPLVLAWGVRDLAGIGWRRGLMLFVTGGPLFAVLQTGGFAFASLAHGALIAPATVTLAATLAAGLFLGERVGSRHVVGAAVAMLGLALISWHGITSARVGDRAWIGDLLFVASSLLWTAYSVQIRAWRVDAVRATGVVAVLAMLVTLPGYIALHGWEHLAAMSAQDIAVQGLTQGLIQALLTVMAYTRAIALLGVSRAVLFPALIPGLSIVIGIPLAGEIPSVEQWVGLALVTAGLLVAVGAQARRPAAGAG
jgi:drug/metabolite transporter (DMT)-like permease